MYNFYQRHSFCLPILLLCIGLASCSTQKNTWTSRTHHILNTKYNVYFNGNENYKEGIANISKANKDDYSNILPMYPISHHENASAGTSNMTKTIEKCRKSIKLHSIKKKPQKNYKKANDPKYKAWYEQEEFNSALDEAWLLLAKAEFHKGDFLGSIGTFLYISKHYANDKDIVTQCQLWIARAYAEMGWFYEAEDMMLKINPDELKRQNAILYSAVNADILLKKEQYKEAVSFLQLTIKAEKDKESRTRFHFILGQLNQLIGNNKAAEAAYKSVIKANPPFEMDFNARINQAEMSSNKEATIKFLKKMAKKYKFKDNLDQIYGSIGNIYLQKKDTVTAIENYIAATEKSTQNGIAKAVVLVRLGDLYYEKSDYVKAQPCYSEASKIISAEDDDYSRVSQRAETLSELIVQHDIVVLQDSLQRLSKLSDKEQMAVALKIIEDLEKAEKEAEEAALKQAEEGLTSVNTGNMLGGNAGGVAEWYFYNTNLMKSGKSEFIKKWGQRKLEDNWRRASKAIASSFDDENGLELATDSTQTDSTRTKITTDVKDPAFYLSQIPKTEEQLKQSDREIATALYQMGFIYKDRVQDLGMALKTFDEFERRFPTDSRMTDAYYTRYLISLQQQNTEAAEYWRQELIRKYPDSKQAQILAQPNYAERVQQMNAEQDSLYMATYKAYSASQYETVFNNKTFIEQNYPLSPLMPKFLFLNALSIAKTQNPQTFGDALRDMIKRYPESDVSAMAKDMLAMMNQGMESKTGESHGTLLSRREKELATEQNDEIGNTEFSSETNTQSLVLILIPANIENLNNLLYQVALFNFSQFLIKDFDLSTIAALDKETSALQVGYMDSLEETKWYVNLVKNNPELTTLFNRLQASFICLTETNMKLIMQNSKTIEDYLIFTNEVTDKNNTNEK